MPIYDYLVVGGSLAGCWLAYYLTQYAQQRVLQVVAPQRPGAASVAAGIVNPITGRHLLLTWRANEILPFAEAAYTEAESFFNSKGLSLPNLAKLWHKRRLIWQITEPQQAEQFHLRSQTLLYAPYIEEITTRPSLPYLPPALSYAQIQAAQANIGVFTQNWLAYQQNKQASIPLVVCEEFNTKDLQLTTTSAIWRGNSIGTVVFCEGHWATENPYFSYLPHAPVKGEALHIKISQAPNLPYIIKGGLQIAPMLTNSAENDIYWCGSTYNWTDLTPEPTEWGLATLQQKLQQTITAPYHIIKHVAAIRPATKQRRPFLGRHPVYPQLAIFNGLGTKGTSLAPFFGHLLCKHLTQNHPLEAEIALPSPP